MPKYRHIVSPYVQGDNICSHTPYHLPVVQSDTVGDTSDETANAEPSCYSRCDMIKIPFCSKVIGVEHRPKVYSSSSVMVTSSYECNIFDMVLAINNQQIQPIQASIIFIHIVCHRASKVYLNNNK